MTNERKGWVCAKDRAVLEGEWIRNRWKSVMPHRQQWLSYPAGYFDENVEVWTGCPSCLVSEPHDECHHQTIVNQDQLVDAIGDFMRKQSFADDDRIVSVNWSMPIRLAIVYVHLRKQARYGIGPLSVALEKDLKERLPLETDLRLVVRYDERATCIDCGCSDMSKMRLNNGRGHRGAMECYTCVPKRAHERLMEMVAKMAGHEIELGEDVEEHLAKIVDAAECALATGSMPAPSMESFARAIYYHRNKAEIDIRAEHRAEEFMHVADIMWSLASEMDRKDCEIDAVDILDLSRAIDSYTIEIKEFVTSMYTFRWRDVDSPDAGIWLFNESKK